jgi:hypothetical protein
MPTPAAAVLGPGKPLVREPVTAHAVVLLGSGLCLGYAGVRYS